MAAHLLLVLGPATARWLEAAPHPPALRSHALHLQALSIVVAETAALPKTGAAQTRALAPPQAPVPTQQATPARAPTPMPLPTDANTHSTTTSTSSTRLASAPTDTTVTDTPQKLPTLRLPPSRTLAYTVQGLSRGRPLEGSAELAWRQDGQQYEAWLWQETGGGRREMRSTGTVGARGLSPSRFGDRTERADRGSEQALHFDMAVHDNGAPARRVRFSSNLPETLMPEDAQDRLSVLLQLAAQVAGLGRPLRPGDRLTFSVAATRWSGQWEFRFEGEEQLALPPAQKGAPRASLPVLRLHRAPAGPHDLDIRVWLAPSLDYLPVRWRLVQDNGDWLEQHWTGAEPGPRNSLPP